ncbi:MAG: efflux RND transporter periplasmic adaptor subunit [Moorella sp. (in: Bacteria)]|nr:efflux RND transporter periplasmic adaptor subunit [Moorella sp. (in: firmicutes)]
MVRDGDQLRPGMLFLRIMDVDNMQLEAQANQVDASLLRIGQPARVGLDAFPDIALKGHVYSIGSLAKEVGTQAQYVRTIPVRIKIEEKHPQLIPDLSGYADVVVARKEKVTQVPLAAVHRDGDETYVWVQQKDRYERRPVVLGLTNYTHAEVLSGLKEGETVLLGEPPKASPAG